MAAVERSGASLGPHLAGVNTDTEASPAERVRALCDTDGEASVAAGCAAILRTGSWEDHDLLVVLGGRHALGEYARTARAKSDTSYWAPTWAARGLLYAWTDTAAPAVVAALAHDSNLHVRVRGERAMAGMSARLDRDLRDQE